MSRKMLIGGILLIMIWVCSAVVSAQETSPKPDVATSSSLGAGPVEEPVTLMKFLELGGAVLWVTMGLGFLSFVLGVYYFLTLTPKREVPPNLAKRLLKQIRAGDLKDAYEMCKGRDELLANVVRAGLRRSGHDRYVIQDAMESEGERGVTALWHKISHLNNIGVIAPLLGLLGTVWGMLLAFNRIAADDAQVRGTAVAENVSKAMITTVGGLVVAIPSLAMYYYLRGRVIKIIAEVEAQASEVIELLSRHDG